MTTGLIYDVGLHNGDDTAYYLSRGFRVVAIEADPTLVDAARERFAAALSAGQLTILNVGISEHDGESEFWICDRNTEWNSFIRENAGRDGSAHHSVTIPTRRFAGVLSEFGAPSYLKIDIEGADRTCLQDLASLPSAALPRFVSWENDALMEGSGASLEMMHEIGYARFKLIHQATYGPVHRHRTIADILDSLGWRAMRFGKTSAYRALCSRFTYRGRLEQRLDWRFPMGSSGPWGDDLPGGWLTIGDARALMSKTAGEVASGELVAAGFWCDWHAAR